MIQLPILPDVLEQSSTINLDGDLFDVRVYWSEDVLSSGGAIYLDVLEHGSQTPRFIGWALHAGVVATLPARDGIGAFFCRCVDVEPRFDNTDRWSLWYIPQDEKWAD